MFSRFDSDGRTDRPDRQTHDSMYRASTASHSKNWSIKEKSRNENTLTDRWNLTYSTLYSRGPTSQLNPAVPQNIAMPMCRTGSFENWQSGGWTNRINPKDRREHDETESNTLICLKFRDVPMLLLAGRSRCSITQLYCGLNSVTLCKQDSSYRWLSVQLS